MAKLARYEYHKKIYEGLVAATEIQVIKGSFWDQYEVSGKKSFFVESVKGIRFFRSIRPVDCY